MMNEINPKELEVGQVVQWENKWHAAAVVNITEDLSDESHVKFEAEILEPIFGFEKEIEEPFTFGRTRDEDMWHYSQWKVKPPGEMTDYCNAAELDDHRQKMNEIEEKYGEE